jgi:hypothetical protein
MGHRLAVVAGAAALAGSLAALAVGRTGAQPGSLDGCIRAGKGTESLPSDSAAARRDG